MTTRPEEAAGAETRGIVQQVAVAKATVENLRPSDLVAEMARDVVLVDVREPDETDGGVIPGAVLVPRGMLEFRADPASSEHFGALRLDRRTVVYCQTGWRSALAVHTLHDLGYRDVAHLQGGMDAWAAGNHPVVPPDQAAIPVNAPE